MTRGGDKAYHGFRLPRDLEHERNTYPPKDESWQTLANCLGANPDLFFPGRGDDTRAAKAVCAGCTVRARCLEYALTPPLELWGVWGGLSERERRGLRPKRMTRKDTA